MKLACICVNGGKLYMKIAQCPDNYMGYVL